MERDFSKVQEILDERDREKTARETAETARKEREEKLERERKEAEKRLAEACLERCNECPALVVVNMEHESKYPYGDTTYPFEGYGCAIKGIRKLATVDKGPSRITKHAFQDVREITTCPVGIKLDTENHE